MSLGRNVEVKLPVADPAVLEAKVRALADSGPFELEQDDTFFACAAGRLKLRQFTPDRGELIAYERPDTTGPKLSRYSIAPTQAPDTLRDVLARALGTAGRVRKHRRLYRIANTRVHLDAVEGLGSFLELEVVLSDEQSPAEGESIAHALLRVLDLDTATLIDVAYVDLLTARAAAQRSG